MMGGLQAEILILRRQQLNVLRRNTRGPRQDEKYRYRRGLAFLIFALIALPVPRALIPDQLQAQSVQTSKATLAQAANAAAAPARLSIAQRCSL
jgi:hypothetical protein